MKTSITYGLSFVYLITATGCYSNKEKTYFLGEVVYAYTYDSRILNTDSLVKERPSKGFLRYDSNNHQSVYTGKDTITYYYSGSLNKCLSKVDKQDKYECENYGVPTDTVLAWKIYDTNEEVLGLQCRILEMQKKNSWVKYYVSKQLKIAPATYQKHQSYNWDFYGEKTGGGLILKSEHRFKNFVMRGVAIKAEQQNSSFKAFEFIAVDLFKLCDTASSCTN